MKKFILIICSIVFIVSCSLTVAQKNYYQLTSDFDFSQSLTVSKTKNYIWIESINVASFLDKTGIVYQIDDVQYATANNNLWLTPLSDQIKQRLAQDLSVLLPNYIVTNEPTNSAKIRVSLYIDQFHGSYTGDALIKGRWLITNSKNETITKYFDYKLRLDQDGYSALVKTLSKGWQEEQIDLIRSVKF